MKSESMEDLDPDIAALLRTAEPYPDAPAGVQIRVGQALMQRIADARSGESPTGSSVGSAAAGAPKNAIVTALASSPFRIIAGTFVAGAIVGAGLHAVIRPAKERVVYVERAPLVQPLPAVALTSSAPPDAPEVAAAQAGESLRVRRAPAPPEKRTVALQSDLGAEQALLDVARRALAQGRNEEALGPIERHARRYPDGILTEEREALAVNVLVALQRQDEARQRAAHFFERYPKSLLRGSVEAALRAIPQ
jgi:hypothetical protein